MFSTEHSALAVTTTLVAVSLSLGCGPVDSAETAPAFIEIEPGALSFGADDDALILTLKNTGGEGITFSLQTSAQSVGVTWLEVTPTAGSVEPGGSQSLLVQVINRDELAYATYEGSIQIDAPGLVLDSVPVTMQVGKPRLQVEPGEELDFSAKEITQTITVRNAGEGILAFSLHLPGAWLTTDADLAQMIAPGEPQTITLAVERSLAPWYGAGGGDLVVTSNGAPDGPQGDSVTISVLVSVAPACQEDEDCEKTGYYCGWVDGSGQCVPLEPLGSPCAGPAECESGFCANGVCCQSECGQPCEACDQAGFVGKCEPLPAGTACDDGSNCTADETCQDGQCGGTVDCSALDHACGEATCDESLGECVADTAAGKCLIDGECLAENTWHDTIACLRCLPEKDPLDWSAASGKCYIDETCFSLGDPTGEECRVCDPSAPYQGAPAADGELCTDDGDVCTDDVCVNGLCEYQPASGLECDDGDPCTKEDLCDAGACSGQTYGCNDDLECTQDTCNGDGTCTFTPLEGSCLIDGICQDAGALGPNGCMECNTTLSQFAWSAVMDGTLCSDGNGCTLEDECAAGLCVGFDKDCGDGLECTDDLCSPDTGECGYAVLTGHCLIGEVCYADGDEMPGSGGCSECASEVAKTVWTAINEGLECDDDALCTHDDLCSGGACAGTPYTCDDSLSCTEDQCTGDSNCTHVIGPSLCAIDGACYETDAMGPDGCNVCDPLKSTEAWTSLPDTTPCDDGDLCTLEDQCQQGVCEVVPKDCSDGLDCTTDVCVSESGECAYSIVADTCLINGACRSPGEVALGTYGCALCNPEESKNSWTTADEDDPCDDSQYCTVGDHCVAGACESEPRSCPDDACNKGVCDEATKECAWVAKDDGILCDDGDVCTVTDMCISGSCGGAPRDCSQVSSGPCITGTCDPNSEPIAGACVPVAMEDDEPCDMPGAQAYCFKQACIFDQCVDGYANCNGKYTDGCEVHLADDLSNCGECENECEFDNATPMCAGGKCYVQECLDGYSDCDKVPETGCETDVLVEANHCGACGMPCHDGEFYDNAAVECVDGGCNFVACLDGFADVDEDCSQGGPCMTGCEECSPLADGTIEIPDDWADNDCVDGDAYNSQNRGFYVDMSFPFDALCPAPGVGDRDCPFEDIAWALLEAQVNQDWSDPDEVKREVYVASGVYEEVGTVLDLYKPLMVLGGYQRTAEGPWTRDPDGVGSELIAGQGAAIISAPDEGWAVVDGFKVTSLIQWSGTTMISRVTSDDDAPLSIETTASNPPLFLRHSTVTGGITLKYNDGSTFRYNKIGGDILSAPCCVGNEAWTFVGNEIGGNLSVGSEVIWNWNAAHLWDNGSQFVLEDNVIGGNVHCYQKIHATDDTFGPKLYNSSKWTLSNNAVAGYVALTMDFQCGVWYVPLCPHGDPDMVNTSQWTLTGNTIQGYVQCRTGYENDGYYQGTRHTVDNTQWLLEGNSISGNIDLSVDPSEDKTPYSSYPVWTLRGNVLSGDVSAKFVAGNGESLYHAKLHFVNNTFVRDGLSAGAAVKIVPGAEAYLVNNAFVSLTTEPEQPVTAINETAAGGDVTILRSNYFIGFDVADHVMFVNEGANPLNNAAMLNMLSDLPECGRGDNMDLGAAGGAGFVSVDPEADGFMELLADSPLVDAGLELPHTCEETEVASPDLDVAGQVVPCDDVLDVGAWQYCVEE